MKRLFAFTAFAAFAACTLHAQATNTTVCDVIKNPTSFDGKMVTIKGTAVAGFDQFVLDDGDCNKEVSGIWLEYPAGSKAKAGPVVNIKIQPAKNFTGTVAPVNRAAVTLNKDKEFKTFDSALSSFHSNGNMCLGCVKSTAQVTITGRIDAVQSAVLKRDGGKITGLGGFGNLNAYPARLVIASVADVTPKDVDFSKADAAAKAAQKAAENQGPQGQPQQGAGTPSFADARTNAEKLISTMAAGDITTQMQKDLSMLPKPKEQNGVVIQQGTDNEVSPEGVAGTVDSPDGMIYNCTLNRDKLQNMAVTVALLHVGQHIADVRAPIAGNEQAPMVILENNAWAVTSTLAIFGGEKVVATSGGYLLWNTAWPEAERVDDMQSGLRDFLAKEEILNR
jgi:hypothetical protein